MADEIRKCPFCGDSCTCYFDSNNKRWLVICDVACFYRGPGGDTEELSISAHNDLCDLVDKGRQYDEMHSRLNGLVDTADADAALYESQRDEAVRLLIETPTNLRQAEKIQEFLDRIDAKSILNRIEKGGGE